MNIIKHFVMALLLVNVVYSYQVTAQTVSSIAKYSEEKGSSKGGYSASYELILNKSDISFGGLQFKINLPDSVKGVNMNACLAGVPESHIGAFTSCDYLPKFNEIRVVMTDLGMNREIPNGLLGVIDLMSTKRLKSNDIHISQLQALDVNGKSIISDDAKKYVAFKPIK